MPTAGPLLDSSINCAVCQHGTPRIVRTSRNRDQAGDIVKCDHCGLVWVSPFPSSAQISAAYNGLYATRENLDRVDPVKQQQVRGAFRGYLDVLRKCMSREPRTFADLGGGLGYYSEAAQHAGLDATLLDMDTVSIKFAHSVLGVQRVHCGDVANYLMSFPERRSDVVMLRHVIEHIVYPADVISGAAKLLAPGGCLVIETPNNHSWDYFLRPSLGRRFRKFYRARYCRASRDLKWNDYLYAIRPPEHVHAFTMQNLSRLLQAHGLRPVLTFTYLAGDRCYWPNEDRSGLRAIKSAIRNRSPGRLVDGLVDVFTFPLRLLVARLGRGTALCIYALKEQPDRRFAGAQTSPLVRTGEIGNT